MTRRIARSADLVWQHPQGAVAIWMMNGAIFTGDARSITGGSTEWRLVRAADFNGDGQPDLLWQHSAGPVAAWMMNGTSFTGDARTLHGGATEWRLAGRAR